MEIDHQAPLVDRKEIFINASPKVVWKLQSDINAWNNWQPRITMSKLEGPLAVGSIFHWKVGGLPITSTLRVVQPNKRIGWTGVALGTRARHIYTFQSKKNGTLVIAEESLDGWLARLMKVAMPKFLDESMDFSLKTLKVAAEGTSKKKI
ncbi:MAG: SRPBCC family protein [Anaerolineales bacterium]|nr:SRPBCC family protein [Anaerolineales bacterium]